MYRFLYIILLFILCQASCEKEEDMQVRVQNNYSQALNIAIGPTNYGVISSGETTIYRGVPEGSHQIYGDITGSITIEGIGKHKFTLFIHSSGGITLQED